MVYEWEVRWVMRGGVFGSGFGGGGIILYRDGAMYQGLVQIRCYFLCGIVVFY